ncbi:AMP-binding protein [Nocardia sp. NPDC059764]|uniref:AMP-binding protein n=1 Tax=Nocardia sp. NPDC059764 TaxID=3346939 RepID=UPI003654538D
MTGVDGIPQRGGTAAVPRDAGVALEWCGASLTQSHLEDAVAELAERLLSAGCAGAGVMVMGPLCPAYVVGLLATWRAGGVPIPVDAGLSAEQYLWLMRRTRPAVVISTDVTPVDHCHTVDSGTVELVLESVGGRVLAESEAAVRGPLRSFDDPDSGYVIPTSGSTGEPKAIVGSRRGLHEFLQWFRTEFELTANDRCAAVTRVNFDPSLREILGVLGAGGTLCLPPIDVQWDLPRMADHLLESRPTLLFLVPSIATRLAAEPRFDTARLTDLRLIFFAGEVLGRRVAEQWLTIAPHAEIVNLYGQTEATLAQFFRRHAERPVESGSTSIPVGIPRPGVVVGLADPDDEGVGEVLISSVAPALGALGDAPAADAAHTIVAFDSPLATGDLGYLSAQGELVVIGRCRNDIKFGGKRVSFHDFTEAVEAEPEVRQCVVVDHDGPQVFVSVGDSDRAYAALRTEIGRIASDLRLPRYDLHLRSELPMLRNGKVDRRALLESLSAPVPSAAVEVDPGSSQQDPGSSLRSLFGLDTETIGFADAGISSLEMLDLVAKINRRFETRLSVHDCFAARDLAGLGREIERSRRNAAASGSTAVTPTGASRTWPAETYPLSTRQLAYIWVCMANGNANWCNISREIRLDRRVSATELSGAIGGLFARHDVLGLALSADWKAQTHTAAAALNARIALQETGFSVMEPGYDARVRDSRAELAAELIDPTSPPPLRVLLLLGVDGCSIVLVAHHLFVDGLGMDVLSDELTALLTGRERELSANPGSYVDYCLATPRPDRPGAAADYWRTLLRDISPVRLPESTDSASATGELTSLPLGVLCTRAVHQMARQLGVSSFAVALAAFEMTTAEVFGIDRVAVVVPGQVRRDVDAAAVGLFMTQLIVRGTGSPALLPNSSALAGQLADGMVHSEWEFDQRITELELDDDGRYPLSTVLFNQRLTARGQRPRALGVWTPRSLGRALRYQLQGELQLSGPELVMTYYYRRGIAGPGAEVIDHFHRTFLRTIRTGRAAADAAAAADNRAEELIS